MARRTTEGLPGAKLRGVDLGAASNGGTVAVYSRCAKSGCFPLLDVFRYASRLGELRLRSTSRPGCDEVLPAISRGNFVFVRKARRIGGRRPCSEGLFLASPARRIKRRQRVCRVSIDYAGGFVAGVFVALEPRSLTGGAVVPARWRVAVQLMGPGAGSLSRTASYRPSATQSWIRLWGTQDGRVCVLRRVIAPKMRQRSPFLVAMLASASLLGAGCSDDGGGDQQPSAGNGGNRATSAPEDDLKSDAGQEPTGGSGRAGAGRGNAGPGPGGEVAVIKRVVDRFIRTQDPVAICRELITRNLVQRAWGGVRECEKRLRREDDDEPATSVSVSDVRVVRGFATVSTRVTGGDFDGLKGDLELRKERGEWRVDEFADLLRSAILRGFERRDDELMEHPGVRRCARKAIADLSYEEIRRLGSRPSRGRKTFGARLALHCVSRPGSGEGGARTFVREQFEDGLAAGLRQRGVPPQIAACAIRTTRSSVSDKYLNAAVRRRTISPELATKPAPPHILRKIALAAMACRR